MKSNGFNVKGVSSDSFQSADLAQQLSAKGYNYEQISVDRVDTDDSKQKLCKPYHFFRNTIYEERITMCGVGAELLTEEITDLERNNNTGKVDHPDGGTRGSKDIADAVCGALWNASQHAEEFAFDYGETLDATLDTNTDATDPG